MIHEVLNIDEMLPCAIVLNSEFGTAEFGQLNIAFVAFSSVEAATKKAEH
jgi:hypothetical protein